MRISAATYPLVTGPGWDDCGREIQHEPVIHVIDQSANVPVREREYGQHEHICADDNAWYGRHCWCLPEVEVQPNGARVIIHRDLV